MMLRGLTVAFLAVTMTGLCAAVAVSAVGIVRPPSTAGTAQTASPGLHVSGNSLVYRRPCLLRQDRG